MIPITDSQHPISDVLFKRWINVMNAPDGVDLDDWTFEDTIAGGDLVESLSVPDALIFFEIQTIIEAFNDAGVYDGTLIYCVICKYEIGKKKYEAEILEAVSS